MKKIALLGSTGSIGTQTLDVVRNQGDIQVTAVAAGSNIALLEKQIREFHPSIAAVWDEKKALELKAKVADLPLKVVSGMDGLLEVATEEEAQIVVTAVVGMIGIRPTIAAMEAGKDIALANKETLVTAGHIIMPLAKEKNVKILPVDSEHSAIFQSLQGAAGNPVAKILLTASGGPFWGWKGEDLAGVTVEQALAHPNWNMGAKISVDSATMMNKGLEFIEAMRLYHMPPEKISIVIHRESIVHSLVEYCDHAVLAQLGVPDMRLPIQYALTWPGRVAAVAEPLDLLSCPPLTFHAPDYVAFPCLALALEAAHTGGSATAVLNGANEEAVGQFLAGQLSFSGIAEQVAYAMAAVPAVQSPSLGDILDADQAAREAVRGHRPDTH